MENISIVIRIIILAVWMFGIPIVVGGCFCRMAEEEFGQGGMRLILMWLGGQALLWTGFQIICAPMVVTMRSFSLLTVVYLGYVTILFFIGALLCLRRRTARKGLHVVTGGERADRVSRILWVIFGALFVLQLVLAAVMTYADGDDAYYVAISSITNEADTMYRKLPYTGGESGINIRHGLAPFPIWISFLARVSGINPTITAHTAVPLMLIPMTYGIFALLGRKLLPGKSRMLPLFLIFTELLVIFGGYSIYTMEHFMIARSRQGKAALCSIVIPLLFLLLLILYERLEKGQKCGGAYWLFLIGATVTGCLCSTMGSFIVCLLIGIAGLCGAICYRRWKILIPLFLCCMPSAVYALLYVVLT